MSDIKQEEFSFGLQGGASARPAKSEPVRTPVPMGPGVKPIVGTHAPGPLQSLMDSNFLQYASYVICERAIPAIEDGLKPVQRRILHALREKDDGRFIKVANIVGHTMQYHPHGDASIGDALVNLVNKGGLIEGQGNFGNIYTGDPAAASRYIECRLTELSRNELFSDELTEFVASYDGRNQEPVRLPSKLPLLLMLGADGIAVGISTRILPHNFAELLEAQIAILRKQPFEIAPDFPHGGLMDLTEYADGTGSVRLRAVIEPGAGKLTIREIPWTTTTETVIASIEEAIRRKRVAVATISDFTAEKVEIQLTLESEAEPRRVIESLYAFTSCEVKLGSHIVVLREGRPVELKASEVLDANTQLLLSTLRRELTLRKHTLLEELQSKTLIQIFVENRIYKRIEECTTYPAVQQAVLDGLVPFRPLLRRDVTRADVEKLLEVRIRRISQFDISKNRKEIDDIVRELEAVEKNLGKLVPYAIGYLQGLLKKYGAAHPRRTRITRFEEIEVRELTASELKLEHDVENGYIGYAVKGEPLLHCSSLDKLIIVWKDGRYRVMPPPEKLFVDKNMIYCALYDRDKVMTVVYWLDPFNFSKRFAFGGVIMNKDYQLAPPGSEVLLFSDQPVTELYARFKPASRQRIHQQVFKLGDAAVTTPKARGCHMTSKVITRIAASKPRWWQESN